MVRYLFALWCVVALTITSAYQSKLASFLTKSAYDHQISTIEELAESPIPIGGVPFVREMLKKEDGEHYQMIVRKWNNCPLTIDCVNRTANNRNFAVVKSLKTVNYLTPKIFTFPDGRPKLYGVRTTIVHFFVWFHTTKGLPYLSRFNHLIRGIQENGLISKWTRDVEQTKKFSPHSEYREVGIQHLKVVFFIYIAGNGLAIIIFLCEIYSIYSSRIKKIIGNK